MSIVNKAIKNLNPIWKKVLINELKSEYFQLLTETLDCEKEKFNVLPSIDMIFNSLNSTLINDIKVVIIGQDPYFNKGQANGLCFSVHKEKPLPPSLKNIFTCLKNDLNSTVLNHGDLSNWANQGVLLLNTCLTVREGVPNSHKNIGWRKFTDAVIQLISK